MGRRASGKVTRMPTAKADRTRLAGGPNASAKKALHLEVDHSLPWPDNVPLLSAADVRPHASSDEKPGRGMSLPDWLGVVFPGGSDPDSPESRMEGTFFCALMLVQVEELGVKPRALCLDEFSRRHTTAQCADLWNRAVARLGYTSDKE